MKMTVQAIALIAFAAGAAQAGQYETYAFGDSKEEACEQVKSDLRDQAILECKLNGRAFDKAEYGECRQTEFARGRYTVERSVEFTCKPE